MLLFSAHNDNLISEDGCLLFYDVNKKTLSYRLETIRELKQTRRRRKRERHAKMRFCNHFSAIIFRLFSHYAWKKV